MAMWRCIGCCRHPGMLLDWQRVLPWLCGGHRRMICCPPNDTKPRRALAPAGLRGVLII